jgi:outer membrane beta-barrel protein
MMTRVFLAIAALVLTTVSTVTHAQNVVDVGVVKDDDIKIVQKLLYPKAKQNEFGAHLVVMPFDAFTFTPAMSLSFAHHIREDLGFEGQLTGGYGLKNSHYKQLESPAYGVAPDVYRFLGSAMADVQWSPIYAKMNVAGRRIFHHDIFVTGGLGVTYETAIQPDASAAIAPTLGLGVGARVYTGKNYAMRLQLRDDMMRQKRIKTAETQAWFLKQNVSLMIGVSKLGGK